MPPAAALNMKGGKVKKVKKKQSERIQATVGNGDNISVYLPKVSWICVKIQDHKCTCLISDPTFAAPKWQLTIDPNVIRSGIGMCFLVPFFGCKPSTLW